jgi:hypothetical protein
VIAERGQISPGTPVLDNLLGQQDQRVILLVGDEELWLGHSSFSFVETGCPFSDLWEI